MTINKIIKKCFNLLSIIFASFALVGCNAFYIPPGVMPDEPTDEVTEVPSDEETNVPSDVPSDVVTEETVDLSYRVKREFKENPVPSNQTNENELPDFVTNNGQNVLTISTEHYALVYGDFRLDFILNADDKFIMRLVDISKLSDPSGQVDASDVMFVNNTPAIVTMQGSSEVLTGAYDKVSVTSYGIKATAEVESTAGSIIEFIDCYYFAKENEVGAFNVRKTVKFKTFESADTGFRSEYSFATNNTDESLEWFVPNNVFITPTTSSKYYKELYLGLPMMMMRKNASGHTLSISRYQPIITYVNDSYAGLKYDNVNQSITVGYPYQTFHTGGEGVQHVYDLSIRAEVTKNYSSATASVYNAHFNLQNQRILDTDIEEVYSVVTEDFEKFIHKQPQTNKETQLKYTSYGLPWRIYIEDGEFGPLTYQAGFVGQQLPAAYNMILHGIQTNDLESLENGVNTFDFWVEDAQFMQYTVPRIWYDTTGGDGSGSFRAYPTFLRMAVDGMEGLLDAYRALEAHGVEKETWYNAIMKFGKDFLLAKQNADGSYYRCFNLKGEPFVNGDDGVQLVPGDLVKTDSYSKINTPIAVRILGKYYEFTGDERYKTAAIKAGEYMYTEIYPLGYYQGGTCDQPNVKDKEAGVYAMYAYDTLYMLTGDSKWIDCLKQATAFTMATVLAYNYPIQPSDYKAAYPLEYGYNDGMSFITCTGPGIDNYISYIYHELFRVYILTGEQTYLKQAEFIQQNTKAIMNWDGALGYKYKSLVAEATTTLNFTFQSADNGVWLPWSSVANCEPIAKMMTNFGYGDVMVVNHMYSMEELRNILNSVGVGGKPHKVYENTVIDQLEIDL